LHAFFAFPVVLAASIPAFVASFIPSNEKLAHHPHATLYAGCFTGMCSVELIESLWALSLICLIGTLLYVSSIRLFSGFGGRLGGIAFTSVAIFVLTRQVLM
tara:strand:- start:413 stop:718 length:306 start_codon:yes stop_codon:yes gene_type:complete